MIAITYLSSKDQNHLKNIKNKLGTALDETERLRLLEEMRFIEGKRKPLSECSIAECQDLKQQIYKPYNSLMSIGKTDQSLSFRNMLTIVDTKIALLNQAVITKDIKAKKNEAQQKTELELSPKEDKPKKVGKAKWDIDLSDL